MEEGSLRCDANVSLRPRGAEALGTKVEIKNLNSFRNVERALEYEVQRQGQALDAGQPIAQETRLFDAERGVTRATRSKEYAHDYRYFPEPDLVPLKVDPGWVEQVRAALPELPRAQRERFVAEYGLPAYDAAILTQSRALARYYEDAVRAHANPKAISNWIMTDLLRALDVDDEAALARSPIPPAHLAELVRFIDDGTISGKIAKDVFARMLRTGEDCATIVRLEGLTQVADPAALEALVEQAIAANPRAVADFKAGKTAASRALVGQVMKASAGKANPAMVDRLVQEKLSRG
jgi:aspartyl-tRNA(Asn)/glutamyl-tRNA(Gln) amidotransferase subunit B